MIAPERRLGRVLRRGRRPKDSPPPSPGTAAARDLLRALQLPAGPAMVAVTTYGPTGPVTVHVSA